MEKSAKDYCIAAATAQDRRRFWAKVKKTNKCWVWLGCTRKGYGDFWVKGANVRAHRAAKMWSMRSKRTSNAGLICCHACNNPSCVRPSHVYWGSHAQNSEDMKINGLHAKNRRKGSACTQAKINEGQAQEIVDRYFAGGISSYQLAQDFQISRGAVDGILRGKRWAHCVKLPTKKLLPKEKGYRRGSRASCAKLSESNVLEIRRLRAAGWKLGQLADKFGVLQTNICAICNRKTWRHLP